jgi:hypothetical protein
MKKEIFFLLRPVTKEEVTAALYSMKPYKPLIQMAFNAFSSKNICT